jgi:hypothetical protein
MKSDNIYKWINLLVIILFLSNIKAVGQNQQSPDFWGIFISSNGKLIELKDQDARNLKIHGNLIHAKMGIASIKGSPSLSDPKIYFIVYGDKMNPMKGARPVLSKINWDDNIENYTAGDVVNLKIGPIPGLNDAYKFIPENPLNNGIYCFHSGRLNSTNAFDGTIEENAAKKDIWTFIIDTNMGNGQNEMESIIEERELRYLASQMKDLNERVKSEWKIILNIYSARNSFAEEIVKIMNNILNSQTNETKELTISLDEYKLINKSDEIVTNKELFNSFSLKINNVSQAIGKVFLFAQNNKINSDSLQEVLMKMENLENKIAIQRGKYNIAAQSFNIKINEVGSDKFFEKYPDLRKKCYFEREPADSKPIEVKF